MLMMYFRFTVQRSTIFNGSEIMSSSKFDMIMKRIKPIFVEEAERNTVAAKIGGSNIEVSQRQNDAGAFADQRI